MIYMHVHTYMYYVDFINILFLHFIPKLVSSFCVNTVSQQSKIELHQINVKGPTRFSKLALKEVHGSGLWPIFCGFSTFPRPGGVVNGGGSWIPN